MRAGFFALTASLLPASAQAALTISNHATKNVACDSGVCKATARGAVLNVADLGTMLASGNVTIKSGSKAQDIIVVAPLSWTSSNSLTLDAYRSIAVKKSISDFGPGALTLTTNDKGSGGALYFIDKCSISFLNTSNKLTINGKSYTLENSLPTLAAAVAKNPSGFYALANSYDAKGDGIYTATPIAELDGVLEGLGNTISHFSLLDDTSHAHAGLIGTNKGRVSDLELEKATLQEKHTDAVAGGMVAYNIGILWGDHVSGKIVGAGSDKIGGLVGWNGLNGVLMTSSSSATVTGRKYSYVGGLVGFNSGAIDSSFATGDVSDPYQGEAALPAYVGGLIGRSADETVSNSYATASANADGFAEVGGFAGDMESNVSSSYSAGAVAGGSRSYVGGFMGEDLDGTGVLSYCYWDIDTSGTDQGVSGGGNVQGLTGLSDEQLKAALPVGFDPAIWAQNSKINKGYPYLIANPRPK